MNNASKNVMSLTVCNCQLSDVKLLGGKKNMHKQIKSHRQGYDFAPCKGIFLWVCLIYLSYLKISSVFHRGSFETYCGVVLRGMPTYKILMATTNTSLDTQTFICIKALACSRPVRRKAKLHILYSSSLVHQLQTSYVMLS